jgi:uncharacterized membrane protein YkvA (DUF1232 family)
MARTTTRGRRPVRAAKTLLASTDFTAYLREKAEQLAPGDLQGLVVQTDAVRARAERVRATHPRLTRHVELGMRLIHDHATGQCPQIPYYTICLLAVALLYFVDPLDVIPDWIPGVGATDDALVFELAFALARPGIERYCTWKGISTDGILLAPKAPGRPTAARPIAKRAKVRKVTPRR